MWIVIPGFILSVFLHGLWNQSASFNLIGWYAFFFALVDIALVLWILRQSFYFKFVRRLKARVQDLIIQIEQHKLNPELGVLMGAIQEDLGRLCMKDSTGFKKVSRKIICGLPSHVKNGNDQENADLMESVVKIFSLLRKECPRQHFDYWVFFFFKFAIPGFIVMLVLMQFV